jgi:hypothetical protein
MIVHKFKMGDVEDPYLMAAAPLWEWENTEQGKWVMTHAVKQPVFYCKPNDSHGYTVEIHAELKSKDLMYYFLKWTKII